MGMVPAPPCTAFGLSITNSQQLSVTMALKPLEIPGKGTLGQCLDKLLLGTFKLSPTVLLGSGLFQLRGEEQKTPKVE